MTIIPDDLTPPELSSLDAALRGATFEPRESLEPEIAGRFAAGERVRRSMRSRRPLVAFAAAAGLFLWFSAAVRGGYVPALDVFAATTTTNLCCQDLDGVGGADDGVVVETVGSRVRHLMVYEEHDQDSAWTPGETVRFARLATPMLFAPHLGDTLLTHQFCCGDYDGGGEPDDGVLVVASATGSVLMAALFDRAGYPTHNQLR